ncbi:MAG TPA: ATP-binding cassette domain-containing protein [Planctomycetaceae bacterium]|jgi:ABC-type sugar transport system ATPase subunit|nr:ATP-binding cassette domain-containing protein [Planctomycetaceae bacterium]
MIALRDVSIRSGSFVLSGIHLNVPTGQYAVLMGATGQGKTTILEAVCGLRSVIAGQVLIDHVDMTRWKPANRGIGYVPQDLALFPTMTVREHLEFALRLRRASRAVLHERVEELSHVLGIEALLPRGVQHLSGGEAQRVALGRALAFDPHVLLLDEPLAALDETTRHRLCDLLRSLQRSRGLTTLHVTHSRHEAQWLADCLFVMENRAVSERALTELASLAPQTESPGGGAAQR